MTAGIIRLHILCDVNVHKVYSLNSLYSTESKYLNYLFKLQVKLPSKPRKVARARATILGVLRHSPSDYPFLGQLSFSELVLRLLVVLLLVYLIFYGGLFSKTNY